MTSALSFRFAGIVSPFFEHALSHPARRALRMRDQELFGGAGCDSRAEVSAQRGEQCVRLGLGRVEPADEAGEGLAPAVELEAVRLQRVHHPAWKLKEN